MENPFEIILEKLNSIETAIKKINVTYNIDDDSLLTPIETCELLKIKRTSLWKHTKNGKLTSYGMGNRVYYKKAEVLKSVIKIN